jgi:hypothetical protein
VLQVNCRFYCTKENILNQQFAIYTDWANGTDYGKPITSAEEIKSILPMILQYLTPKVFLTLIKMKRSLMDLFVDSGFHSLVSVLLARPL